MLVSAIRSLVRTAFERAANVGVIKRNDSANLLFNAISSGNLLTNSDIYMAVVRSLSSCGRFGETNQPQSAARSPTMRVLVLALLVAAAAADARKWAPRRQAVQSSPSGLPGGGAIARGRAPLPPMAMITPYDNVPLLVAEEGAVNFLSLYGGVLTLRILLSWFPQAQGVAFLQPIFTVSDVYLNLFRGVIPAIAGLDISPIAAFFVLNLLTSSVASLG